MSASGCGGKGTDPLRRVVRARCATTNDLIESRLHSEPVSTAAPNSRKPPGWAGWLAVGTVTAFLLAEAGRIVAQGQHVVMYGDQALLELGTRRAIHLDQLVGPYSRSGFHHPGPAVFYLLAPF